MPQFSLARKGARSPPRKVAGHVCRASQATTTRRQLLGMIGVATGCLPALEAQADVLKDLAVQLVRPEDIGAVTATVKLLDAKSVLRQIQDLAMTPMDSHERFEARVLLPGFAKRLREVGPAVGTLSTLATGSSDDRFSERYGGSASEITPETAVYYGVGRTITISGRTIQKAALEEGSTLAAEAIDAIDAFLFRLPTSIREEAQTVRVARAKRGSSE